MRKTQLSLLAATMACLTAWGAPVSPESALATAERFAAASSTQGKWNAASNGRMRLSHTQKSATDATPLYYVFNRGSDQGYVLVSADDRLPEIIGYSQTGSFDPSRIPDNMRGMMRSWDAQTEWLLAHPDSRILAPQPPERTVDPLLGDIMWDQTDPYNRQCPNVTQYDKWGDKLNSKAPAATGCVATALGQIMYYHKWPEQGSGTVRYTSDNGDDKINVSAKLEGHKYDWDKMLPSLTKSSPAEAISEVSTLLFHVGASFESVYGFSTGATDVSVAPALKKHFGYDKGISYVIRDFYTENDWNNMLQTELLAGRPVAYGGLTRRFEGHFFVLDGVNAEGYYHVNWGWSGMADGWFLLTILEPDSQGTGGASGSDAFFYGQNMITGIRKPGAEPSEEQVKFTAEILGDFNETVSRQGTAKLSATGVWNNSATSCTANLGFIMTDADGNVIRRQFVKEGVDYGVAYGEDMIECAFSFNTDLAPGIYTIRPFYQIASENYAKDHFISTPVGRSDRWTAEVTEQNINISTSGKFNLTITEVCDENGNVVSPDSKKIVIKVNNSGTEFNGAAQVRCYIDGKFQTLGRTIFTSEKDAYVGMSVAAGESQFVFDNTYNLPGHENYVFEIRGHETHLTNEGGIPSLNLMARKKNVKIEGPEMPPFFELEDNLVMTSIVDGVMPHNDVRGKAFIHNDGGNWTGSFTLSVYDNETRRSVGIVTFDEVTVSAESDQWIQLEGGELPETCEIGKSYELCLYNPIKNELMIPSDFACVENVKIGEPIEKKAALKSEELTVNPDPIKAGESAELTFEVSNDGYTYDNQLHFIITKEDAEQYSSSPVDVKIDRGGYEIVTFIENIPSTLKQGVYKIRLIDADGETVGEHDGIQITASAGIDEATDNHDVIIKDCTILAPGALSISIYSSDGRLMGLGRETVPVGTLECGAYAVRVAYANDIVTFKFVK